MTPLAPDTTSRRKFWTRYQPGYRASEAPIGSPEFFAQVEAQRYALEPDILELVQFERWAERDVLEAGCGIATDGVQFVRAGARYTGIDFSPAALELARRRMQLEGSAAEIVRGSIVELPFADASLRTSRSPWNFGGGLLSGLSQMAEAATSGAGVSMMV